MRVAALMAVAALGLAGCTETVDPAGVSATTMADARPVAFDQAVEARKLATACVNAEFQGVNALSQLTGDGYQYIRGVGDAAFIKQAPKSRTMEMIQEIAVRKKNDNLPCTIHVRPYTQGPAVLAVVKDELRHKGWQPTPTRRGSADWFAKDGRTISVLGWVPGQNMKYLTGAEVSISRISN